MENIVCLLASAATEEQKEQPLNTHLTDGDDLFFVSLRLYRRMPRIIFNT